jgi:hypothetical protein
VVVMLSMTVAHRGGVVAIGSGLWWRERQRERERERERAMLLFFFSSLFLSCSLLSLLFNASFSFLSYSPLILYFFFLSILLCAPFLPCFSFFFPSFFPLCFTFFFFFFSDFLHFFLCFLPLKYP